MTELYTDTFMIEKLYEAEAHIFDLIADFDAWKSVDILYEKPRVERVWREWGDYRVSIHALQPCGIGTSYLHPHPWPAAFRILEGSYEETIGRSETINPPFLIEDVKIRSAGHVRAMTDKNVWHAVRPLEEITMTLMVSGKPWDRDMPKTKGQNGILSDIRMRDMLAWSAMHYEDNTYAE